jgi:16S rRNA (uracil1498-N3)-methyltransferase
VGRAGPSQARARRLNAVRRVHLTTIREGTLPAPPEVAHYLTGVLRLPHGEKLVVFGGGAEADCVLAIAADGAVSLSVAKPRNLPARRPVTLLYALAKGDKVDAVVRDATELGVTRLVIFAAERSIVKLEDDRAQKRAERWQKIAEEAARQSGRADPPEIAGPLPFAAALASVQSAHKWLLHPAAPVPLGDALKAALATTDAVAFVVGPEGGFSGEEIALATAQGFGAASFGTTTLRTETVPAAVLGTLAVMGGT